MDIPLNGGVVIENLSRVVATIGFWGGQIERVLFNSRIKSGVVPAKK